MCNDRLADRQSPAQRRLDNIAVARKGRLTTQRRILLIQGRACGLDSAHGDDADQTNRNGIVIRQINTTTTRLCSYDSYRRIQVITGRTDSVSGLQS